MLSSGKKFRATKKINILTLVLSEKEFLNETKNHNPPFKLNGRSLIIHKACNSAGLKKSYPCSLQVHLLHLISIMSFKLGHVSIPKRRIFLPLFDYLILVSMHTLWCRHARAGKDTDTDHRYRK